VKAVYGLRTWFQEHLPKSCREVNSGEDGTLCSANAADAFGHVHHGVLVVQRCGVQSTEILHKSDATILFLNGKDGAVVPGTGRLNDTQLEPFSYMFLHLLSVGVRNLKLFNVDRLVSFDGNFVQQRIGTA